MKRSNWVMSGLVAVLVIGLPWAMAQDDGGKKGKRDGAAAAAGTGKKAPGDKADRAGKTVGSFDYAGVASELGLSKEQTEKLAGLIINQQALLRAQRLGLTDEQKVKVKALCMETGKEVLTMDARGQGQGMRALDEKIRTQVLTDEQRAKIAGRGGKAPTTQKAGAGK